ncbi:hypothetical protein [Nostoc favosum]|uniref:Transposase n=1 Tax=Nostoc favosum CHAB5714 TaxID=2780399 RepID=A0ABS8IB59_9NOSO|nr:hypothetical protein [Nostoc favosum]MCC5601353.1 hypothetical protein [Nostoc favosum CHAB5714]
MPSGWTHFAHKLSSALLRSTIATFTRLSKWLIERTWAVLENYGNGSILDEITVVIKNSGNSYLAPTEKTRKKQIKITKM